MTHCLSSSAIPLEFRRFLDNAPKAELHIHLRGAMPPQFFGSLLEKYPPECALENAPAQFIEDFKRHNNIQPFLRSPIKASPETLFRCQSFDQFLSTYLFTSYFCRDATDFRNLIKAVQATLTSQNIVYAEITVSLFEYLSQGIAIEEIALVLDETTTGAEVETFWIVDLVRNIGPSRTLEVLETLLRHRPRRLVGITLGGSEHRFPPAQFKPLYDLAREEGLRLSVHAGEALGPSSVWDALNILGAERIGHGIRSIEDPKLMAHLAAHRIPLEVCPTSNIHTGICHNYKSHPLPLLHEAGIPISLNTDDPAFFHTTLVDECLHVHEMGVSEADIVSILAGGFQHAFMPETQKTTLLKQFEDYCDQNSLSLNLFH